MPELPEVETIRLGLDHFLRGKTITSLDSGVSKLITGDVSQVIGASVLGVRRRAKVLLIDLSSTTTLLIHLKMTGQLVFQSKDEVEKIIGGHPQAAYNQPLPHKHTHVVFHFDDGSTLYFNDLRKFGWIQILPTDQVASFGLLKTVGPEPLSSDFTAQILQQRLQRYPNRIIFQSLLDQSLIAGIGNIYANEALYEAGIHPKRRVREIKPDEWPKLWHAIQHVLAEGIRYGGTSDSTYVNVEGGRGDYLKHAHVYRRTIAQPCGHEVIHQKIGGRTTHYCPIDQT